MGSKPISVVYTTCLLQGEKKNINFSLIKSHLLASHLVTGGGGTTLDKSDEHFDFGTDRRLIIKFFFFLKKHEYIQNVEEQLVANSADAERFFSLLGVVKYKLESCVYHYLYRGFFGGGL